LPRPQAYLDVTAAAASLLKREAAASRARAGASQGGGGDAAAGEAEAATEGPPPPLAPGSFEGWHVAGCAEGADGAAAWWGRPPGAWGAEERLLAAGARVVAALREAVEARLGFTCSAGEAGLRAEGRAGVEVLEDTVPFVLPSRQACCLTRPLFPRDPAPRGIAHSKVLAKLASGLHKPRQQTLVPAAEVAGLLAPLPLGKLRSLGGKFGDSLAQRLAAGGGGGGGGDAEGGRPPATVGDLAAVPLARLVSWLGEEDGQWCTGAGRGAGSAGWSTGGGGR
jgi:DNA polymerase eta